jgi:hypothetical protein
MMISLHGIIEGIGVAFSSGPFLEHHPGKWKPDFGRGLCRSAGRRSADPIAPRSRALLAAAGRWKNVTILGYPIAALSSFPPP